MDKPSSKKLGGQRFSGSGQKKMDPRPGTLAFYAYHFPERLNNTALTVRNSTGWEMAECQIVASRILRWNESPLAHMRFDNPEGRSLKDFK